MAAFKPALDSGGEMLLSNSHGAFIVMPVARIRNLRHAEREQENPSKWHGFSWGRQKILDGWTAYTHSVELSPERQAGFETDLVTAKKTFSVNGAKKVTEEVFVPDRLPALAVSYSGMGQGRCVSLLPEFDMRDRYSNAKGEYTYSVEAGKCYLSCGGSWAAMGSDCGRLLDVSKYRFKSYPEDAARHDTSDYWCFSPCEMEGEKFFFGFGRSREEAARNFSALKCGMAQFALIKKEKLSALYSEHALGAAEPEVNRAFDAVAAQLLSLEHGGALGASGDKWFAGDSGWLRDACISLEAFFELGLFRQAREVLSFWLTWDKMNAEGLFADRAEPEFSWRGVDGTLWLLRRAAEYVRLTGDKRFFEEHGGLMHESIERIADKRVNGKGLVLCKPQETWMDTRFTPRDGYPVEVQALFAYDCLLFCSLYTEKFTSRLAVLAAATNNSLNSLYRVRRAVGGREYAYLADRLTGSLEQVAELTPNQLIAFDCGVIEKEVEMHALAAVRDLLAGRGVRTLAPDEKGYFARHAGDESYHRGSQWPWLNYMAAKAEIRHGGVQTAFQYYLAPLVPGILGRDVGGVPELYNGDGSEALVPRYQTWSLASFIVACKEYARAMNKKS